MLNYNFYKNKIFELIFELGEKNRKTPRKNRFRVIHISESPEKKLVIRVDINLVMGMSNVTIAFGIMDSRTFWPIDCYCCALQNLNQLRYHVNNIIMMCDEYVTNH